MRQRDARPQPQRGFLRELLIESGRSLGRGLALLLGAATLGALGGTLGAVVYGIPIGLGAVLGLVAVGGIALFILFAGLMY